MKAGTAQAKSCCVCVKPKKIMQKMHGIIPQLFDCWADPVAHLLLLKSSMATLDMTIAYVKMFGKLLKSSDASKKSVPTKIGSGSET